MRLKVQDSLEAKDTRRANALAELMLDGSALGIVRYPDMESAIAEFSDVYPVAHRLGHGHAWGVALRLRRFPGLRLRSGHSTRALEFRTSTDPDETEWLAMSERNDPTARVEWLGRKYSNLDKQIQSLLCYRYTTPQSAARSI